MKTLIATLLVTLSTLSQASTVKESTVPYEGLDLINTVVEYCPEEIKTAILSGRRTTQAKISYDQKSGKRRYYLEFMVGGGMIPAQKAGTLTLKLNPKPKDPMIADAPTQYNVSCQLKLK